MFKLSQLSFDSNKAKDSPHSGLMYAPTPVSFKIIKSAIWTVLLTGDIEFSAYISINGDAKIPGLAR